MVPARGRCLLPVSGLAALIGRRDAIRLLGGGGLSLGLGACGFEPAKPEPAGGRLRVAVAVSSTADTMDPARQTVVTDFCRCAMVYDGLTRLDAQFRPEPALAEAIETADARDWSIRLRKGVRFHDGSPLTVADVVYSLRRHLDPGVGSKARVFAEQFASVVADGPDRVRVVLKSPNADLPTILGIQQFQIIRDGTREFHRPIGTGPMRMIEFAPGVRSIAARFDDYWRGPVRLGEVELFAIPDDSARINALLSGDVDLIHAINPRMARHLTGAGFELLETKSSGYTNLIVRVDRAPGNNPDFVAGMKLLLDRETMRTAIFRGYATIGNDQPIAPTNPYYDPSVPQRPFDPERARFHFRRAGLIGAQVPIVTSTAADKSDDMAVLIQDAGRRAGIDFDIRRVPSDGYWTNSWMKVPLGFGNTNPRPTADISFTQFFASDAAWNESGWRNARFDRLLVEARGETDEARRKSLYGEMQHLVHDHAGVGIPLFLSLLDAHSPRVKGLRPMPQGGLMGFDFAAHVWLEGA
ncbi:ABC transporter substrate-binding protein [Sphingomonas sp. Leaf407]|nr:ABC transporter substrate-binding protein [Sphingomonas sp. Leaf42]KQT30353.1 ABC transporter substrate-binding protein [Sphingomonas sp. Leaf407]